MFDLQSCWMRPHGAVGWSAVCDCGISCNQESRAQFENLIKPQVYIRRVISSTMYEKAPFY